MAAKKTVDTQSLLEECRRDLAAAKQRIIEIEGAEDDAVDTAAAHAAWRISLSEAKEEADRLGRLAAKLERQIDLEAEEQAVKAQREREIDAERSADAAADLLTKNYGKIVSLVRDTLRIIAEADKKIDQANRSRASELDPLKRVEARAYADDILQQREVISDRIVERWCYQNGNEVPADRVPEIRRTSEMSGVIETAGSPLVSLSRPKHKVELRRFREITFIPEGRRRGMRPLATVLCLPDLTGNGVPGWTPIATYNPVSILDRLDKLEAPASEFKPDYVVELIPIQDDEIGFTTSDEDAA
jgi:hypothetical protein